VTRALDNQIRLDILSILGEKGKCTVTEVYTTLRMEQSVASQHLAELRKVDIVSTRREGKNVLYSINEEVLYRVIGAFCELDGICEPAGGEYPGYRYHA
jgi:DNA-binding transcriptional ArsR family regulator